MILYRHFLPLFCNMGNMGLTGFLHDIYTGNVEKVDLIDTFEVNAKKVFQTLEQAFKSILRQKITILFHCSKVFFIFRSYITLVKPMLCETKVFSIFMEQWNKVIIKS